MLMTSRRRNSIDEAFHAFAVRCAEALGSPRAFLISVGMVLIWSLTGPLFGFSDTWQLLINTATTIVTFLMVFLIQNTQNRDARAIHLKLDELIRSARGARNRFINLEELSGKELEHLRTQFELLQKRALDRAP
jgi:low affinity Fe/Cu permease